MFIVDQFFLGGNEMKKRLLIFGLSLGVFFSTFQVGEAATTNSDFKDVKPSYWAYNEIKELKSRGIAEALVNNEFAPNKEITRAQAARMIVKMAGSELHSYKDVSFKDVPKSHPDYKYIALTVDRGIFSGKSSTTFDPDGKLTRAQMAKILSIAFNLKGTGKQSFPDVKKNHWANEYINILFSNKITSGTKGNFLPNDYITRGQQAVFLYRVMNIPGKNVLQDPFPEFMKDTTLFDPNMGFRTYTLAHPLLKKVLLKGQEVVRKNKMKIVDADWSVEARSEGYKNPKDKNFRQVNLTPRGNDEKSFFLRFDFRDEKGVDVASKWFELLLPEIVLTESIKKKALEAKNNEYRGIRWEGNSEIIKIEDYEIKYGVTPSLDFFNIEVKHTGK
jgi:hypothetical protein